MAEVLKECTQPSCPLSMQGFPDSVSPCKMEIPFTQPHHHLGAEAQVHLGQELPSMETKKLLQLLPCLGLNHQLVQRLGLGPRPM